jgi:hypothetical protein
VPLPTCHTQVIVIGACLKSTPEDCLCIDVQSLNLPSTPPTLPLTIAPPTDEPSENPRKFSAHAPPCQPPTHPQKQPSRIIAALDAANILQYHSHYYFNSPAHFFPVFLPQIPLKHSLPLHLLSPNQMTMPTQTLTLDHRLMQKANAKLQAEHK